MSGDKAGMLEYWSGPSTGYSFPKNVLFQHKLDTDLYEFVKVYIIIHLPSKRLLWFCSQHKVIPLCISFSPNGKMFAVIASDRKV